MRKYSPAKLARHCVLLLIMCYFDYACCSWYSALSQKNKNKLQIMQNKIVRFILGMGPRTHIGQEELGMVGMIYHVRIGLCN